MSLRIKKINDKLNNYELKIIGNPSKNTNKIHYYNNVDNFKQSKPSYEPLREISSHEYRKKYDNDKNVENHKNSMPYNKDIGLISKY